MPVENSAPMSLSSLFFLLGELGVSSLGSSAVWVDCPELEMLTFSHEIEGLEAIFAVERKMLWWFCFIVFFVWERKNCGFRKSQILEDTRSGRLSG